MTPIEARLRALRKSGRAGLVPFVTAGHPEPAATVPLLAALERAGAAAVEVGVPFSDPLADGPAIQRTSQVALEHGVTLESALDRVGEFTSGSELPVVLMTYVNPVLACGPARFARRAREAGVSGVILTDLPPDERPDVWSALTGEGLATVLLIAPTTDPDRRDELARRSSGFVYCVSRTGVTGDRGAFAAELREMIEAVRVATDVPIGVGFGVADEARAREVAAWADAVIVGTALCERLESRRGEGAEAAIAEAEGFVRRLVEAVTAVGKPAGAG